jgi:putative transposase
VIRQEHHEKGTAVTKTYQSKPAQASAPAEVPVPEQVTIALAEIVESAQEGLLALAVGAGLQVMQALMADSVSQVCGPPGQHNRDRVGYRPGTEDGSVTEGGRRVQVRRPRVRAADGSGELPVTPYELFAGTEVLGRLALERMLAGLSTRRYQTGLEPVGEQVEATATATSKSAVSRRFVTATETTLAELMGADLSGLDLVAVMVDGVHFAESCCVVGLGIGLDGTKHPLAVEEGSTENATLVTDLLVGLRERGLDVTRPILAVLDGSKALRRAVLDVFDAPVIQRCQQHKIRNVKDKLPERLRTTVERRMRAAYQASSALVAEAQLGELARELDKTHPGAAASLREGLEETLTVLALGVPPTLARTMRSTNAIESMISICREHSSNVKRWQGGQMALRWCAAGMVEAGKQFRRVNGHLHLPALRTALDRHVAANNVVPTGQNETVNAA